MGKKANAINKVAKAIDASADVSSTSVKGALKSLIVACDSSAKPQGDSIPGLIEQIADVVPSSGGGDVPALNPMLDVTVNCFCDQQLVDPTGTLMVKARIGGDIVFCGSPLSTLDGLYIGLTGGCRIEASPLMDFLTLDGVTCSALDADDETVETYPCDSEGYIHLPDAMPAGAAKLILLVNCHSEEEGGGGA